MASEISNEIDVNPDLPTKFINLPSPHLKCPICGGLYKDPVINIKCGHTFCRICAFSTTRCPIDESHCDTNQIVVNRLVVGQIEDLQIYCRHGLAKNKTGEWDLALDSCSEIISYGRRSEHEGNCLFALVKCPYSERCAQMRKKDLEQHKKYCDQIQCKFLKQGCTCRGTLKKIEEHSKICPYQSGTVNNGHLAVKVAEQALAIQTLQDENMLLTKRVGELEESRTHMKAQMDKQGSLIKELQQKMESLLSRIELVPSSVSRRPLSASQICLAEGGANSCRRSSVSSQRSTSPGHTNERWEMPFQFKCIGTLRGHKDVVWALSTKKGHLYSAGADGIIKIWSLEQLAKGCVGNITAHKGVIHCLATWENTLLSAGADKSILLWNLGNCQQISAVHDAHDNIICSMVVCNDLLFTSSFGVIKVWDLKTMHLKTSLQSEKHWVRALACSRAKDKLYSGSHNAVNVWDIKDKFNKVGSIKHEGGSIYSLAVSKTYIFAGNSGNYDQSIQVFRVDTHEFVMNFCSHLGTVTHLIVSPSGQFLISGSHDSTIQFWNLESMLPYQNLSRHQGSVNTLTLHGDFLLSGSEDHEIKVFRYFRMQ
ncbi:E3 ubiquitin-protein ligase traf7-like [Plakobranchus ocellatus]|uniref:E3 ubiquitin-protein ligase traf7-like n=1 Tax=Plakobranchus ocellatus TaxID=259542 RepID=A0AAV3Z5H2_9GAST|nr:E3 ubiquitin-protein ligase traf7-like [Plakobranchus ocellatus]